MADSDSIFEDGENLQAAIGKALHEKKALLCFVADDGENSTEWEVALLDESLEASIRASAVALRLTAGSEQAGFLNAVCLVQSVPAVIIILNAQVVANYQHDKTTLEELQRQLAIRYATHSAEPASGELPTSRRQLSGYLNLPPSDGRMRLPNNAYDHLRKLTQQYLDSGVSGKGLLHIQLSLLKSLKNSSIHNALKDIEGRPDSTTDPQLPDEVVNKLLNTPASSVKSQTESSQPSSSSSTQIQRSPSQGTARATPGSAQSRTSQAQAFQSPPSSGTAQEQNSTYRAAQQAAELERQRIKSQIEDDKRARRESERLAREANLAARRRQELADLRKANSTTSDPKPTDIRIQVRTFDGSTIRSAFAADGTIGAHVRPWIDAEIAKRAEGRKGEPYNLKIVLGPGDNRVIEAGEEENRLEDVDGVRGSATFVMVPVHTYVESYGAGGDGGLIGGAVGAVKSVAGSAGAVMSWALGGWMGSAGAGEGQGDQPVTAGGPGEQVASRNARNSRMRTLADQRNDEEEEARSKGTQLYNGMGLNVQPRKGDEGQSGKKD